MPEIVWMRCENCRRLFRAPRWRSHCYFCGRDEDETNLSAVAAFVALVDLVLLFLWYWS